MEDFNQQSLHFLNLDDNTTVQLMDEIDKEVEEVENDEDDEEDDDGDEDDDDVTEQDEDINLLLPSKIWNEDSQAVLEEFKSLEMDL